MLRGGRGEASVIHPKHPLVHGHKPVDVGKLVAEPIVMSELTVGYGQAVLSLFTGLGIRPNILAVADNIETMKVIVQSGSGIAIVPRACADNEVALGALKTCRSCRSGPWRLACSAAVSRCRRKEAIWRPCGRPEGLGHRKFR